MTSMITAQDVDMVKTHKATTTKSQAAANKLLKRSKLMQVNAGMSVKPICLALSTIKLFSMLTQCLALTHYCAITADMCWPEPSTLLALNYSVRRSSDPPDFLCLQCSGVGNYALNYWGASAR